MEANIIKIEGVKDSILSIVLRQSQRCYSTIIKGVKAHTCHFLFSNVIMNDKNMDSFDGFFSKLSEKLVKIKSYAVIVPNILDDYKLFENKMIYPNIFMGEHGTLIQSGDKLGVVLNGGFSTESNYYLGNYDWFEKYPENKLSHLDLKEHEAYITNKAIFESLEPYMKDISFVVTNGITHFNFNDANDSYDSINIHFRRVEENYNDKCKEYTTNVNSCYMDFINNLKNERIRLITNLYGIPNYNDLVILCKNKAYYLYNNCVGNNFISCDLDNKRFTTSSTVKKIPVDLKVEYGATASIDYDDWFNSVIFK